MTRGKGIGAGQAVSGSDRLRHGQYPVAVLCRESTPIPDGSGFPVAVKVVHVSDLSDMQGEEGQLGRLVVEYPGISERATLEVSPEELEGVQSAEQFVRLEWTPPGQRIAQVMIVPQTAFDSLAKSRDMETVLRDAISAAKSRSGQPAQPRTGAAGRRGKINYATLEHAGEPHRGRITEAEKELVRGNLDKINKRLRGSGQREIDANDPAMKERYGL